MMNGSPHAIMSPNQMNKPIAVVAFLAFFIPTLATESSGLPTGASPIPTTVCDIVREPSRYSGETVQFRAIVSSDGFEYSSLFDPKCDKVGLGFQYYSEDWEKNPKLKKFDDALGLIMKGAKHYPTISGTFTGLFTYDPNRSVTKRRLFEITEVEDLHVKN
jgi:hypothetical protein